IDRQRRAAQYVCALLTQHGERRNAAKLAAATGATPRAFQRLLSESPWAHGPVIEALQAFLAPMLNADDGVWALEEIVVPKAGSCPAGATYKRNDGERLGGNCQAGIFLAYVSSRGHALVDGRLYLPQDWADDHERRRKVGVPESLVYQSKWELGQSMLQ